MMSYEMWLDLILDAARNIASPKFQKEAWLRKGKFVSSPDEVYQVLMEDCTFDLFFQIYGNRFTEAQMHSSKQLRSTLQAYYNGMSRHPDPVQVLNDPQWELVRQSAVRFVREFGGLRNS